MQQYTFKKRKGILSAILLSIGIVVIFSITARFLGDISFFHTEQNQQARHTGLLWGTIAEAASLGKAKQKKKIVDGVKLLVSSRFLLLRPLEKKTFEIGYKNNGALPWKAASSSSKGITLRANAKRESYFYDTSWKAGSIIQALDTDTQPGEVVFFRFTLEAPKKGGSYTEKFSLYQGEKKLPSSEVILPIEVRGGEMESLAALEEKKFSQVSLAVAEPYQFLEAKKLIQSHSAIRLKNGSTTVFEVGYKNVGRRAWRVDDMLKVALKTNTNGASSFADQSWFNSTTPSALSVDTFSGMVAYFRFLIRAPETGGAYTADFYLSYGDEPIVGSEFSLPIEVERTAMSPQPQISPQTTTPPDSHVPVLPPSTAPDTALTVSQSPSVPMAPLIIEDKAEQEPLIRIGYFSTLEPVRVTAFSPYEVRDGNLTILSTEQAGAVSTVTFDFALKKYFIQTSAGTSTLQYYPRFTGVVQPSAPAIIQDTIFEILSYSNRPAWSSSVNDNKVRGALEVRYSEKSEKIWVINELQVEQYLKGLAETSNNSPYEFQKALIIAARTYAKYHIENNTKYQGEYFTIRATDHDQVYRGYGAETRLPNVTRAVNETRGVIVYFQGALAITPYYSQSDGRTRAWEQVWGGPPKPWLVSKEDPAGKGLPLLGHGVGMPARGAISLAIDGKTFEEILKYYYTGIELRRRY